MSLEALHLTLLVLSIQAVAYRVLPVLQNRYRQNQRNHGYGNRLPGLFFVLLLMPVFAWIPHRAEDSILRGTLCLIFLWLCPSKFLSIAWDTPIDNLPPGFFYFAIASIIPLRIKGRLQPNPEPSRNFENRGEIQPEHSRNDFETSRHFDEHSRNFKSSREVRPEHSGSSYGPSRNSVFGRLLLRLLQGVVLIASTNAALFLRDKISIFYIYGIYCVYLYVWVDLWWSSLAKMAEQLTGLEMYPSFNDPFLATSLSEFWGRRWNLVVTVMLRATVYNPVLDAFGVHKKVKDDDGNLKLKLPCRPSEQLRNPKSADLIFARAVATVACFLVSGLFHEVIFCYINRSVHPTWEVTAFFIIHGFATVSTLYLKKQNIGDLKLPTMLCRLLTLSFLYVTVSWLFIPPATRTGADVKSLQHLHSLQTFATRLVSNPIGVLSEVLWNL